MGSGKRRFLVTGAAGFIGSALVQKLLARGDTVVGIDNMNSYYDPSLKESRLKETEKNLSSDKSNWIFINISLENEEGLNKAFSDYSPEVVVNLAAQAGVRYSIENPKSYVQSNLVGFCNLIECCRHFKIRNFIKNLSKFFKHPKSS